MGESKQGRRRWPWIVLGLILAMVALLRVALPAAVERGAAYASRYWLGLPVRIENVDFALIDGRVLLDGVSIGAEPDGVTASDAALRPPAIDAAKALLHIDRISAHLSWSDLRGGAIRLGELAVEGPSLRLLREADGAIDPLRHAVPEAPESPPEPEQEEPPAPWPLLVDRFALSRPDVVIVDPPSGDNLLEFSLESFALDQIAVRGSDFALGGVDVQGPVLRVRRDLVLASPSPQAAATPPQAPAAPVAQLAPSSQVARPGYRVEKIDIQRATFSWVTEKGPLDVALALKASGITADEGQRFPIDLQLEIGRGRVGVAGEVGVLPPSYKGTLKWSGLPFPPLLLASLPDLAAWLRSADSSGDFSVDLDIAGADGPPALEMYGRAAIETLSIADPGDKEVAVGWKQLEVAIKQVTVPLPEQGKPARTTVASFDRIRLVEPKIRYTHPSPALNALLGIPAARPASAAGAAPAGAGRAATTATPDSNAAAPVDLSVSQLELTGGDLEIVDTTVAPPVVSTAKDLFVSARELHFPDPSAKALTLRAILPKESALTIDGELRPGNNGEVTLTLQKLDLPVFSPYAAAAASASLDAGQASLQTRIKLRGAAMSLDNDLVLRKLGVSLRDPESFNRNFGMPIDLALALLRDPAGDISLSIPVRIDEKGAQVSTGAVIASALRAALIGAVTSPLKLLGGAFSTGEGGGALAIAPVASVAGSAEPAADAGARVDGLVKLLSGRPAMGLELRGRVSGADRPLIAEQILIERARAGDSLPDLEGSGFLARRRITQVLKSPDEAGQKSAKLSAEDQALYGRYVAAVEIPPRRLDELAAARAARLRDRLVAGGIDGSRATLGAREADGDAGVVLALRPR